MKRSVKSSDGGRTENEASRVDRELEQTFPEKNRLAGEHNRKPVSTPQNQLHKTTCRNCGVHVEYACEAEGQITPCPRCGNNLTLSVWCVDGISGEEVDPSVENAPPPETNQMETYEDSSDHKSAQPAYVNLPGHAPFNARTERRQRELYAGKQAAIGINIHAFKNVLNNVGQADGFTSKRQSDRKRLQMIILGIILILLTGFAIGYCAFFHGYILIWSAVIIGVLLTVCLSVEKSEVGNALGTVLMIGVAIMVIIGFFAPDPNKPANQVTQSSWDGSVPQVKDWLKAHANDPSSLEFKSWNLSKYDNGNNDVFVTYRAKNGFGALMLYQGKFVLSPSGIILSADPSK